VLCIAAEKPSWPCRVPGTTASARIYEREGRIYQAERGRRIAIAATAIT
jgi:hypothetical protein